MRTTRIPIIALFLSLLGSAVHAQSGKWTILPPAFNEGIGALCAVNDDTIFVGTRTSDAIPHIYRSTDGGSSWVEQTQNMVPVPNLGIGMSFIKLYGDTLFALLGQYFYKSGDWGDTWVNFGPELPGQMDWMDYSPTSRIGYGRGDGGNFKYTTDGWNTLSYRPTTNARNAGVPALIGLGDTILFGSGQDYSKPLMPQVMVSYNGGNSFFAPTGLPLGGGVSNLECKGNTCYCIIKKTTSTDTVAKVGFYKSTDAGSSWANLTQNLPYLPSEVYGFGEFDMLTAQDIRLILSINFDTTGFGGPLVRLRILQTNDGGQTWRVDSTAWNDSLAVGLNYLDYCSNRTAFASYGNGRSIIKYELSQTTGVGGGPGFQNSVVVVSPNPSGSDFIVDVSGTTGGTFELTNALGQVVINQPISIGSNTIARGSLPAGIYTYTVRNGATSLGSGQIILL